MFRRLCFSAFALIAIEADVHADVETLLTIEPTDLQPRNSEGDLIQLRDGRLCLIYSRYNGKASKRARGAGTRDDSPADLAMRISADGGRTWSDDHIVVEGDAGMNVMSVSLLRLKNGTIALFYLYKNSLEDCRPMMRVSKDEARTWNEATLCVPDEVGYFVLNNDRAVELSGGRIILPLALHNTPGQEKPDWAGTILCYFSDDAGKTWRASKDRFKVFSPAGERVTAQEPGVIELKDGRLLMFMRTNAGSQYVCYSSDRGDTWTKPTPSGLASPVSPATIERLPWSGDLVCVWNDHTGRHPFRRGKRTPLCVAISRDEGKTWEPSRAVERNQRGWYCYTSMSFLADRVLLSYCAGNEKIGRLNRLKVVSISREVLEGKAAIAPPPTLSSAKAGEGERAFLLILNGREFPGDETELPFYPCRANVLEFRLQWHRIKGDEVELKIRKTAPDGREAVFERAVTRAGKAFFTLGPLAVPPVYDFEAGEVLYRGYRLDIRILDAESGDLMDRQSFYQSLSKDALTPERFVEQGESRIRVMRPHQHTHMAMSPERLVAGEPVRQVYNPAYGVEPALVVRLSETILEDPDALRVLSRLTPGVTPKLYHEPLSCELEVRAADGETRFKTRLELKTPGDWTETAIDPRDWPAGDYRISLAPILTPYQGNEEQVFDDGPAIVYRRRLPDGNKLKISHLAPWSLERDPSRELLEIRDFDKAASEWSDGLPAGWKITSSREGRALYAPAGADPEPLVLRPRLGGHYAVFARPAADGCLLKVRGDGLVRSVLSRDFSYTTPRPATHPPLFVVAADLTRESVAIYAYDPWNEPRSGLRELHFMPVTAESVKAFYRKTSDPPRPLFGINDWCDYFHGPCRLNADQLDVLVGGQTEVGLRHLNWSLGRSWIEYRSELPGVTYFPAVPLKEAAKKWPHALDYAGRATMVNQFRPLERVLSERTRLGATIWPWLSMNRHYGEHAYGGIFASRFFKENPQWHGYQEDGHPAGGVVSYFFPEVRRERLDIFLEVAKKSPDGLLIGTCRQVPMLRYHPKMVEAYIKETGVDPRQLRGLSQLDEYKRWITWRADHFTQLLRDLKTELAPIREKTGRPTPVAVRIPSSGFFYNMAEGLDVRQWLEEGLVDQLMLDPLHERGGEGSHDVRPYVELGAKHGVSVLGGVGATWTLGVKAHVVGLKRARGLLAAGVDGIAIYETNYMARTMPLRWIVPLFGNLELLDAFLDNSNLEACYPVSASTAAFGHDGHSDWHRRRRGLPGL